MIEEHIINLFSEKNKEMKFKLWNYKERILDLSKKWFK
jgi:hypothetical protein